MDQGYFLQVQFLAADTTNGEGEDWQHGRKWYLSPHMTESEVVQTALKAVLTAEEHEARELFRYCGSQVFDPHFDVRVLRAMADTQKRDKREAG